MVHHLAKISNLSRVLAASACAALGLSAVACVAQPDEAEDLGPAPEVTGEGAQALLFSGAVSNWNGNGNLLDSIGINSGTAHGGLTYADSPLAIQFNGTNALATFGTTVGNVGTRDFTLAFKLKTGSTRSEDIISKRSACFHASFLDVRTHDGKLGLELDQDASASNYFEVISNKRVNDNDWHTIVMRRAGGLVSIYIDRVLDSEGMLVQAPASGTAVNISNSAPFTMGSGPCVGVDGTNRYTGLLKEVTFYSRALNALTEIPSI